MNETTQPARSIREHGLVVLALVLTALVLSACTSGDDASLSTDGTQASSEIANNDGVPVLADGRLALAGTAWVFEEAHGVGQANEPDTLVFFAENGSLRFAVEASCGSGVGTISESASGFSVDDATWTNLRLCEDLAQFFAWNVDLELDELGRLIIRGSGAARSESALVFTHFQSTSINSEVIPERRPAELFQAALFDTRWDVVGSTGVAAAVNTDQGELYQVVSFGRHNGDGVVISLSYGCHHDSRVVRWTNDGFFVSSEGGQFDMAGEPVPCEDDVDGLLGFGLPRLADVKAEFESDGLLLSGVLDGQEWTLTLAPQTPASEDPDFVAPPACFDYRVAEVETASMTFTEALPNGSTTDVTLHGFIVERVTGYQDDFDGDGNFDSVHHLRLRDLADPDQLVDVVGACGLGFDLPQALVRIHPNTVIDVGRAVAEGEIAISSNDTNNLYRADYGIVDGELELLAESVDALDSAEVQDRLVVTSQPLAADAEGDLVRGVLNFGSFGCIELWGANSVGLVFPVDRSSWDPVEVGFVVDGELYRSGERVEIVRLPRPEFLEYFNPAERTQCGIDHHVVVSIRRIE